MFILYEWLECNCAKQSFACVIFMDKWPCIPNNSHAGKLPKNLLLILCL